MHDHITPAELAEIDATCDAATPGPWPKHKGENHPGLSRWWEIPGIASRVHKEADAKLIALARTWLPRLVDEVKNRGCLLRQCAGATMREDSPDSVEVPRIMDSPFDDIPHMVNSRVCDLECEVAQQAAAIGRMREALVRAGEPLQAIFTSVEWELCDSLKDSVAAALVAIHKAISEPEPPEGQE